MIFLQHKSDLIPPWCKLPKAPQKVWSWHSNSISDSKVLAWWVLVYLPNPPLTSFCCFLNYDPVELCLISIHSLPFERLWCSFSWKILFPNLCLMISYSSSVVCLHIISSVVSATNNQIPHAWRNPRLHSWYFPHNITIIHWHVWVLHRFSRGRAVKMFISTKKKTKIL